MLDLWLCQGPMYPGRVGCWRLVSSSTCKITPQKGTGETVLWSKRLAGVKFPSLAALGPRDSMEEGAGFQRNGTTGPNGLAGRVSDNWGQGPADLIT